jgi:hypothetical protein
MRFSHEGSSALLPADHELHALSMGMKAIEDRQETFPGNTEGMSHALRDQAFDQQVASEL